MPRRKRRGKKRSMSHAAHAKLLRGYSRTPRHSKETLSKARGHIPLRVLESFHDKMPAHYEKLGRLIARRRATGE